MMTGPDQTFPLAIRRIDPDAIRLTPLELDPAGFQSALPVQNYHLIHQDDTIGLAVGIWDTTTMQETFGPYPGDEFITVLDGSFAILDHAGNAVSGTAVTGTGGDSATFRNGIPVSWKQDGYLRKIYLTLTPPKEGALFIGSAAGGVTILPSDPAVPGAAETVLFRNDAGTMTVTLRCHQAATGAMAPTTAHELCRVLAGKMILTDAAGQAHHFGPGDHVFVPAGTPVARQMQDATLAYHVLVLP